MLKENLHSLILDNYDEFLNYKKNNSDIEIAEADFSHSSLSDTDLTNIDFSGSSFMEASLVNVDFSDCNLTSVDFSRANLTECKFTNAILNGTNFNYATVNYCDFTDADMAGANMCETDLTDSDLSASINLESVRFDETTVWPDDEKLPQDFDCTYNSDLSSLQDEEETTTDVY